MPGPKRSRRERTDEWASIKQWTLWPEQTLYEENGAPEALVTDGGGQFYSTVAVQHYDMLSIRKERIYPGQPWENYAETLFSIQRRLGDHAFSNARTWPEIHQAHQTWWQNYNVEHHYAHRERQDGRHSPSAVLRGVSGRTIPEDVLSRALYATQFT